MRAFLSWLRASCNPQYHGRTSFSPTPILNSAPLASTQTTKSPIFLGTGQITPERRRAGVLGPYLDSFLAASLELGYATWSMRAQLWVLGHLEQWLKRKRLALVVLNEKVLMHFLEHRRRGGHLGR